MKRIHRSISPSLPVILVTSSPDLLPKKILPAGTIRQLVLATNDNDILSRFVNHGDYSLGEVKTTSSPSMDIGTASNFERYLYYLMDSDAARTKELMEEFARNGKIDLSGYQDQIRRDFVATSISEETVLETIRSFYKEHDYVLDPHTAIGVKAAQQYRTAGVPMICLATAHPAKFGTVVENAIGIPPIVPDCLIGITDKPARCELMDADMQQVKDFVSKNALLL
jgi:threonine synthase